jgi:hypothetical protein
VTDAAAIESKPTEGASMRQTIRLVLVTCVGLLAAGGLEATAAQAAGPVPITGPAISVTGSTATLTGVISPNGNQLEYAFQYGTSTKYDKGTTPVILPAGTANEAVSAQVQGLKAGTTYHFRLVIQAQGVLTANGTYYYYPLGSNGLDKTFKTKGSAGKSKSKSKGKLTLSSTKLRVNNGVASATLGCSSISRCEGTLTLTKPIKVGKHHRTVTLGSNSFSIKAGKRGTVTITLSRQAKTVLRFARHHRTRATLTAKSSTGQKGFRKSVTLLG